METQAQIDGHQDKVTAYNKLSRDAQRNVDVDKLLASIHPPTLMNIHKHQITIAINGAVYPTTRIDDQIGYHIGNARIYLNKKFLWLEQN